MSRTIITITEYPSMKGRYKATVKRTGQRVYQCECGRGEGAAAAKAVELAMGEDAIIIADKNVMAIVPLEFGGKA
ncbi:hypothetical protein [Pseudoalteromonas rhizosphaerae]|uniref:hypothetical protein n=1 Tax=Pseudoalteromonas rhizosphaerae TaxID=2518973 RepID=UPI001230EDC2|nr:hypothetical protein [Pseudoalteromonas rhizosphaerae]